VTAIVFVVEPFVREGLGGAGGVFGGLGHGGEGAKRQNPGGGAGGEGAKGFEKDARKTTAKSERGEAEGF
jgi:hypothetical protein